MQRGVNAVITPDQEIGCCNIRGKGARGKAIPAGFLPVSPYYPRLSKGNRRFLRRNGSASRGRLRLPEAAVTSGSGVLPGRRDVRSRKAATRACVEASAGRTFSFTALL